VKQRSAASLPSVALVLCLAALTGGCERLGDAFGAGSSSAPSASPADGQASAWVQPSADVPIVPIAGAPKSFAELAKRADPAVVFVKTLHRQQGPREGNGSAFVFDPDGLILTNNHVIEGATAIVVIFEDSREVEAEVVGRDAPTDVAVLRVKDKGLPFVRLGDSDSAAVGDWVVAIGNPFGLAHTVSAGIISAKGRTGQDVNLGDSSGYYNFIQTDASINPGNSGGPLLDMARQVVGMNTAIRRQANSIGFAIPVNMVKELLPRLIADGKIRRSAVGILVASLVADDLPRLGLKERRGAIVTRVMDGGPAAAAGLKVDDVIVRFQGHEIVGPEKLRWMASLAGVGKSATIDVIRAGKPVSVTATLGELPEPPSQPAQRQFHFP